MASPPDAARTVEPEAREGSGGRMTEERREELAALIAALVATALLLLWIKFFVV